MPGWMLSIDFGTSNTAAAHTGVMTGAAETLALTHTGNLMVSSVFVEAPDLIDVGDVALNRAETNPAAFLAAPKRVIGQSLVHVNGYDVPPALPVAAVLHSVVGQAVAAHRGQPPSRLVLTHPEAWSTREIGVLVDAAARIGFDHASVTTVSEPRAAAHYYSRTETLAPGTRIAVFDFGGGTLDIAVMVATDHGTFDVIAARGDNGLGGKNLDALLRRWVDQQLGERDPALLDVIRRSAPMHVLRTLEDSIRRAKELLSSAPSATITVTAGGRQETISVTRGEYDDLIAGEIGRAVALTGATFADAGIRSPGDLATLYLTGGASRTPLVHTRLAELGPIATLDDPKTVVAQGALMASSVRAAPPGPTARAPQADAPAAVPTRNRALVVGAAVLVVVVAAVAAGIWFVGRDDDAGPPTDAAPQPSTSTGATPTGSAQEVDAITATFPAALADGIVDCARFGFTTEDALQVRCSIDPAGPLAQYFPRVSKTFLASVDVAEAKRSVAALSPEFRPPGTDAVLNADATAAAKIDDATTIVGVFYSDASSGLGIQMSAQDTADQAKAFLTASGLI